MAQGAEPVKTRRVVVGLDAAPQSRVALAAAAALASQLRAELDALFVENADLLRLAGLPFARELGFPSASLRRLDPETMQRSLRAHAAEARRALTTAAGRVDVHWSFRVARGSMVDEVLAAAAEAELAVLGLARWDREALRLAARSPTRLLIMREGAAVGGSLAALCSSEVPPHQAVRVLCDLGAALGDGLAIVLLGRDPEAGERWRREAAARLAERGREASIRFVNADDAGALRSALAGLDPGSLVLLGADPALEEGVLRSALAASRRPVFVCPA